MWRSSSGPPSTSPELVHPERQVALGRDRRVLLAQAAGRRVARVHEQPLTRSRGALVHPLEAGDGQVHLAAHLEHVGDVGPGELLRDDGDRRHVRRHVLADPAVSACRRLHVASALVADAHRQPVDLQLADVRDGFVRQAPRHALTPGGELVGAHRVVEAHHRHRVDDRGEQAARGAADGLARRIDDDELGMVGLELAQLTDEQVVVAVGDLRVVELVVAAVVVGDQLAQRRHAGGDVIELARPLSGVRHRGEATRRGRNGWRRPAR